MRKNNKNGTKQPGSDEGKDKLIKGIEDEARNEAESIEAAARKAKEDRLSFMRTQVNAILADAKKKAEEQVRAIGKNAASLVTVDSKRLSLKARETMIAAIIERVQKKMESLIETEEYADILRNWVIEAIIGLGVPSGTINASVAEKKYITDSLLRSAEKDVERLTGRKTRFEPAKGDPLIAQGIMAISEDGRTAFNNQVHTRLLRHQSEIRKLIYDELFQE